MSAGWVAGSTRARALLNRRVGGAGARRLAVAGSLGAALRALADTGYGHDVRPDHDLAQAQHAVWASVLWHLRVLAGWLPPPGATVVRTLAGGFEIANVDRAARRFAGLPVGERFRLGTLATADRRLAQADTPGALRRALAASPWHTPDDGSWAEVALAMRLAWAHRVAATVPAVEGWAAGAVAVLVATETHLLGRPVSAARHPELARLLGGATGPDLAGFARQLPASARWALAGVTRPADLWRAERGWWRRVEQDAGGLLRGTRFDVRPVVGLVGLLAVDAWRVCAALELAARGGGPLEAFDAVA